jgi:anhydro-N-acetylmuramic acid kinase
MSLFIGLISGTSMDGVDAALVDLDTHQLVSGITCPYSSTIQTQLQAFNAKKSTTAEALFQLNHQLGQAFSDAALAVLKQAACSPENVQAIGSHGQTLYHDPSAIIPTTLQLGCAHTIAARTGITVVADFRTRDLVLGGQGAPLAPYYHQEIFKPQDLPLLLVNIGGISNLTILNSKQPVLGYDTGPGNVLMDAWVKKHQNQAYDADGAWASSGQVIEPLLERLKQDAYFSKKPPKSADKGYFSEAWLMSYLTEQVKPEDVQATLLHLTAWSIAEACKAQGATYKRLAVCGGGAHNQALLRALSMYLPDYWVDTTNQLGIDADYLEAMMFAWFAKQTMQGQALDLTRITGSSQPTVLGAIYPK